MLKSRTNSIPFLFREYLAFLFISLLPDIILSKFIYECVNSLFLFGIGPEHSFPCELTCYFNTKSNATDMQQVLKYPPYNLMVDTLLY